jgi:LuxR family maltose regulon positive regulatory protein
MSYKLTPPSLSRYSVTRTEVLRRVTRALDETRVVLLHAPAGYGKTTTLIQLHRHFEAEGITCAWLQLDESDNDLSRFIGSLQRVLQPLEVERAATINARPGFGPADGGAAAQNLLDTAARLKAPLALFLDDLEAVTSPAVLAVIAGIVSRLPPGVTLLMAARRLPGVGLALSRARGQLLEIDVSSLRLSTEEAAELLNERRGLRLPPVQVEALHRQTEGWVTALWLASLALEHRSDAGGFIAGLNGADRNLAAYFADVVLQSHSERVRDFLLKTCVLDELTPGACSAVSGLADSAELLAEVERANLFIAAADDHGGVYRCHSLFTGFLRVRLQTSRPGTAAQLHRAASEWFLSQGRPIPAISHALQAAVDAHALDLLEQHVDELLRQGRMRLVARWLDAVPATAMVHRPHLGLSHAWAVTFTRGAHEALAVQQSRGGKVPAGLLPLLWFMSDRIEEAHGLSQQQSVSANEPVDDFGSAMWAQTLANTSFAKGQFDEARRFADLARGAGGDASSFHLSLADSLDGAIDLVQGRLRSALVRLRAASDAKNSTSITAEPHRRLPFPGALFAEALYEAGDLDAAESRLRSLVPPLLDIALPDQLISAFVLLARIQRGRGDIDGALTDLEQLESAGHRLRLPRAVACARLERAWIHLDRREFTEAQHQIDRSGDDAFWEGAERLCQVATDTATRSIAQARLWLRMDAADKAIPLLRNQLAQAERADRWRRGLRVRILLAEALFRAGQTRPSMRLLGESIEIAARDGWVQTFVEEGEAGRLLLAQYAESRPLALADEVAGSSQALLRRLMKRPDALSVDAIPARVDLTEKERKVLLLVAKGDSNEAIAKRLFVSKSTVRTHLRSIHAKFEVSSRTQAVAVGRQLGLID